MNNICVILVEPKDLFNIGSICRSMINFGVSDLRLVNPRLDYNKIQVRRVARKASFLLSDLRVFSSLSEASEDCGFILGTTRRFGKHRIKQYFFSPVEAAEQALLFSNVNRIAYVFGREDFGLLNTELAICNSYVTIPTHDTYRSINLAHSVSICLYEFQNKYQTFLSNIKDIQVKVARARDSLEMFDHMKRALLRIGYSNAENVNHIMKTFCRIFGRSKLNTREIKILQGLWSRIEWIERELRNNIKN